MTVRENKVIPASVARDLLGVTNAEWRVLVAERAVDVAITRTGRGAEQRTNFASIERAAQHLNAKR